jgi:hypothetical protein
MPACGQTLASQLFAGFAAARSCERSLCVSLNHGLSKEPPGRDSDPIRTAKHFRLTQEEPSANQRSRRCVQFIACGRPCQSSHSKLLQPGQEPVAVLVLTGNAPHILRCSGVTLDCTIAHRSDLRFQRETTIGQHSHGAECDGEKSDAESPQGPITVAKMLAGAIMDAASSDGQAKWSVNGNKIRLCLV